MNENEFEQNENKSNKELKSSKKRKNKKIIISSYDFNVQNSKIKLNETFFVYHF